MSTPIRFRFQLRPIEEISPWGDTKPNLHWFGLTDGWFWIEVGDQELFRYSDARIEHWYREAETLSLALPSNTSLPYEDYQVARYFEDLIDFLYAILDPIPYDLAERVADIPTCNAWLEQANQWYENQDSDDDENTEWGIYYTAQGWWNSREWSASHLRFSPNIWIWRHADTIFVRWDNRAIKDDGIPVWAADHGEISLSVHDFIEAVQSFNDAFLEAMQERIDIINTNNPRPEVEIEREWLQPNHDSHAKLLPNVLVERPREIYWDITWDEVRAAMQTIERNIAP